MECRWISFPPAKKLHISHLYEAPSRRKIPAFSYVKKKKKKKKGQRLFHQFDVVV